MERDIERGLRRSLSEALPQSANISITLAAQAACGDVVGGLAASVSYGWMHIEQLWVADEYRDAGIGSDLLKRAERRARAEGCHGAWLDTSNPRARNFYDQRGFEAFGELANEGLEIPTGHRRWFMKKRLDHPAG